MQYGENLLSKILDNNDAAALKRFGIEEHHFATKIERKAFRFIKGYAEQNRGQAPDYRTVVSDVYIADESGQVVSEFNYTAGVEDTYEWLTRQLKSEAAKRELISLVGSEDTNNKLNTEDGDKVISDLISDLQRIRINNNTNTRSVGKTLEELKTEFYDEYQKRKEGKSFKLWKTPFPSLNEAIGGLYSSDIYGIMAESGRGKSYLIIALVDELLRQGGNVLVKSYELKAYLWLSRLFSIITAREGDIEDENKQKVGLPNKQILSGKLDIETEVYFFEMVEKINSYYPGTLYLQAKGGDDLTRSLDDLERELHQCSDIDAVVIDAFYGLTDTYGKNANRTQGGAAEQAARRFERIVGEHDVVGIYAVQAQTDKKDRDEEGHRELKLPNRDQVKTTKALLEIATNLFSFDSGDGLAKLGVEKGRNGSEDLAIELIALMDYGVLKEAETGEVAAQQFVNQF